MKEFDIRDQLVTKCCEFDHWKFQAGDKENVFCCKCEKWTKLKRIPFWDKEFEDELTYDVDYRYAYSWTEMNIDALFRKYFGRKHYQKIKIKCKGGCIQIERIR